MPRISAPSVREHRARMVQALVDAAEAALASGEPVTVAALAASVGIARNSFYKYFDSAADVVEVVATRGFEAWADRVGAAVAACDDPLDRVLAYVDSSLDVPVSADHGWRAGVARTTFSDEAKQRVAALHERVTDHLDAALEPLALPRPEFAKAAIQAMVGVGVSALESGESLEATTMYVRRAVTALMGLGRPEGPPRPSAGAHQKGINGSPSWEAASQG